MLVDKYFRQYLLLGHGMYIYEWDLGVTFLYLLNDHVCLVTHLTSSVVMIIVGHNNE